MDIEYKDVIDFSRLKTCLKNDGRSLKWLADKCGLDQVRISQIARNIAFPKTDLIAKICSVLEVYPSEIVSFNGIEIKECFSEDKREPLPEEFTGELTYRPLRIYLEKSNAEYDLQKAEKELFDQIEPPRRLNGSKGNGLTSEQMQDIVKKSVEARFGEGYVAKRQNRKQTERKGLPPITRTKLRQDRPLSIRTIYEICKKLGCSIDWVLSYK